MTLECPQYEAYRQELMATRKQEVKWGSEPSEYDILRSQCYGFTEKFVERFPELKRVRGWYLPNEFCPTEHFWCVNPSGEIVDPTLNQFTVKTGEYVEYSSDRAKELGLLARIGRCPNCGDDIYEGSEYTDVCSEECASEYGAYLQAEIGRYRHG